MAVVESMYIVLVACVCELITAFVDVVEVCNKRKFTPQRHYLSLSVQRHLDITTRGIGLC